MDEIGFLHGVAGNYTVVVRAGSIDGGRERGHAGGVSRRA
jgi:hypothetical protein